MEIGALLLGIVSTLAAVVGLFSKTDRLLREIRDVLVEIRDEWRR